MYEYLIISFLFIFSRLSLCTPVTYRHRPYPMTYSKRFLAEKGEKRLSFAFSIPSRSQFGRRRKHQDSVARRCSPIIRQPQKLQSRASLAFSLSLSTSLQPYSAYTHYTLFTIYDEGKKKPIRCYASVAVILNCRRSHRVGRILFLFNSSKPLHVVINTDPTSVVLNFNIIILIISIKIID